MNNNTPDQKPTKQILIFKIADEEFAVEIGDLQEIIDITKITPIPNSPDFIEGITNLRGEIVVIINLEKRFKMNSTDDKNTSHHKNIIIANNEDTAFGILVSEVQGVQKITEDQIQETPELPQSKIHTDYIKGVVVLGERLLILMDIKKILSKEELEKLNTNNFN